MMPRRIRHKFLRSVRAVDPEISSSARIKIRPLTSGCTGLCFCIYARSMSESSESEKRDKNNVVSIFVYWFVSLMATGLWSS